MKNLLLARHAKSNWDFPGLPDHERPLNDRGQGDLEPMAAALVQRGVRPDEIVSSTAVRALTTARGIAKGLGFSEGMVRTESNLYLASGRTILQFVQQLDESSDTAMIFGHNPGMHDAADMLVQEVVDSFPTLAIARIEFSVETWGEIEQGDGLLLELLTPKTLAHG